MLNPGLHRHAQMCMLLLQGTGTETDTKAISGTTHRSRGWCQNESPQIIADVGYCAWKLRTSLDTGVHIKECLGYILSQFLSCGK